MLEQSIIYKGIIIIGGGPAGLAAALEVKKQGINDVLLIERDEKLGGILNQCIHDGFGLIEFGELLSGPEYAQRFIDEIIENNVDVMTKTMVVDVNKDRTITAFHKGQIIKLQAGAIILAMGCRERTRGAIRIPGSRPAGIYTAGVAQNLMNINNVMVGKKVVILGSGDIGLIMARRLTLEGANVLAVVEKLPYSSGLPRNINQCLVDFNIPLYLSHTVTKIEGNKRLERLTVARLDENGNEIEETKKIYECDTLILSVGLIPENEISLKAGVDLNNITNGPVVKQDLSTNIPGIFACGNVLHVHDLVDYVSQEGEQAARGAVNYILKNSVNERVIPIKPKDGVRYVVPCYTTGENNSLYSLRVSKPFEDKFLIVKADDNIIYKKRFKKMNPAEMIRITLKDSLPELTDEVEVSIID